MRHSDWPERLADTIEAARGRPFSWGAHDCALFAADCVLAMTGDDPMAAHRGRYTTEAGARRVLVKHGGVRGLFKQYPEIGSGFAQRGDVVLFDTATGQAAGVCLGRQFAAVTPEGLAFRPMADALTAFRVE